jgi:hypothetical protein
MSSPTPITFDTVRQFALALPGVEEGTSYGTPALRVRGKFLARLHEDGETLVIKIDYTEREFRMLADPDTYYVTDHYVSYPMLLVRLARVNPDELRDLITYAWRSIAPKRLVAQAGR